MIVLFGITAQGCNEKDAPVIIDPKSVVEVKIDEEEGTAEFKAWLVNQKARCTTEAGTLEYNKRFRLATCYVPDVKTGMKIWYASKWNGV